MSKESEERPPYRGAKFSNQIGEIAVRKLKAQRHVTKTVWSGLGMMGLIGWSVVVPTLLGAGIGLWLDKHYSGNHSWTLMLLVIGLSIGCFNAWHWIAKEDKETNEHEKNNHE